MKTLTLISICLAAVGSNICLAQSNNPAKSSDWGTSVHAVQLNITITNRVFRIGSSATVESTTKNSSTNDITIETSYPTVIFDLILTNGTGKTYHVTTPRSIRGPRRLETLKPGQERSESIPATFEENIEPGDYILKAIRHFSSSTGEFALESNSIKVQLTK